MRRISEEEREEPMTEVREEEFEVGKGWLKNTDGGGGTAGRGRTGDNRNFEKLIG